MDRRSTLATLLGRRTQRQAMELTTTLTNTLNPYTGPWGYEQAAHLLRRTTFGPTYAQIKEAVDQGMAMTLYTLFDNTPMPPDPVNFYFQNDPNVAIGETWLNAPYSQEINLQQYRFRSIYGWTMDILINEGMSIREQMTLFWHNHFAVSNVNDPKFMHKHITLLRENATGNFRDLVKAVTIDPAMLRFLNGRQNTANAPNENYARELLELFTIGKGPQTGPGDYTNYTEDDIREIAKVLTGWRDRGYLTNNPDLAVQSVFINNLHDNSTKQLSHRFDNITIENAGPEEYSHLIDIIFERDEVAKYICRKLYRWFVYYEISDEIEANIIEPMAQIMIDNDYEIQAALEALLSSEHFFNFLNVGPMIKNPLVFIMNTLRQFEVAFPTQLFQNYNMKFRLYQATALLQMQYYFPPSVAGWKAYYQEPLYYRTWINSTTLQYRFGYTDVLTTVGYVFGGQRLVIDVLNFITTIDNPYDPNQVVLEFAKILFPQPITDGQVNALKEILIPGLPDFEWTVEYGEYAADPENSDLALSIEVKLRNLLRTMLTMPEFYLS
ncbi:MAG: DUF1800 domain-containing protein [Saprospiraceae bacterium]|nr:DUF1800 domain-containing protein [Saprospiraceae bacterium]